MGSGDSKIGKQLEEEFPATEKYYGFHNYGNTCYANSVLQALYFCQPFRMAIMNWTSQRAAQLHVDQEKSGRDSLTDTIIKVASSVTSGGGKEKEAPLLSALSDLFEEIQSQKRRTGTIKPYNFISTLKRQNIMFNSTSQQDAHEFLMYLLNEVSETLEKEEKEMVKRLKAEERRRGMAGGGRGVGGAVGGRTSGGEEWRGRVEREREEEEKKVKSEDGRSREELGMASEEEVEEAKNGMVEERGEKEAKREAEEGNKANQEESAAEAASANMTPAKLRTFVQSIFQGTLTNETRCMTCESVSERDEDFLDVQLDVEQNCSVTHCLARFSKVERLTGTNKFSCETCGALQEAEKRMRFKVLPKILVLHLKRFKYLEHPGVHAKLSHRVAFPVELRIPDHHESDSSSSDFHPSSTSPATSSSHQNHPHPPSNPHQSHSSNSGHSPSSPSSDLPSPLSSSSSSFSPTTIDDPSYQLAAMVVHIGPTAQSGHYVSFIRSHDKWLSMDDHLVNPVMDTETLMNKVFGCWNHNPEEPQNSASAYILFYERKPQLGRS